MFTGIVSHLGKIIEISHPSDWELLIDVINTDLVRYMVKYWYLVA